MNFLTNDKITQVRYTTGSIAKKLACQPAHVQAGVIAYRDALNRRLDWHAAVIEAIETAINHPSRVGAGDRS